MLHPTITASAAAGQVTVHFTPRVGRDQRVTLLLNEFNAPATRAARSFSFEAPKHNGVADPNTETDTVVFPISGVPAGDYLVRVQVDGAQSPLGQVAGKYSSPKITIV